MLDKIKETPVKYTTLVTRSLVSALESVFTDEYPTPQFQDLTIVHQFANKEEFYPLVLVRWHPTRVWNAGLDHHEYVADERGFVRKHRHFLFDGQVEFVPMALTVLDYQLLLDALVDMLAFGTLQELTSLFFEKIYSNEEIVGDNQLALSTDSMQISSMNVMPVPWGSDDRMIFQSSITMNAFGGFYSVPQDSLHHFIEKVILTVRQPSEPDFTHNSDEWHPSSVSEDSGYVKGETIISAIEDFS